MSTGAIRRRAQEARDWLFDACFPLWAEQGLEGMGFCEALDLKHKTISAGSARVRVQARQTYVFAEAARLGWDPARAVELVQRGVDILSGSCRRTDGLFGRRVELSAGERPGRSADLYDTAFALYALASAQPILNTPDVSVLIGETLGAIDSTLADENGGYAEALPRPDLRAQNPHMHLFEACLRLAESKTNGAYIERAGQLQQLCLTRFIDPETGTLGESFEPDGWSRPAGEAGDTVEPGHHFEWVWLFHQYAKLTGKVLPDAAGVFYRFACRTLDEEGRAVMSCDRKGAWVDGSRRAWSQTEALKAHLAMWRAGDEAAGARAVTSFDILMDEHLTSDGGWIDHYDVDGCVLSQNMPASTGYHVVLALSDLIGAMEA